MEIRISEAAKKFFKDDMGVPEDKGVRIKGKVYGKTNVHDGFSVAIEVAEPHKPVTKTTEDGLTLFAEKDDEWFLSGYDLEVDFDEKIQAPTYFFIEEDK